MWNQIYNLLGNAALSTIVVASTATNWYGHEGSIPRYVFWHSIVLVTPQAYIYPSTAMALK